MEQAKDETGQIYNVLIVSDYYLRLQKSDGTIHHVILRTKATKIKPKNSKIEYYIVNKQEMNTQLLFPPSKLDLQRLE